MGDINGIGALIQRDPISNQINSVNACAFSFDEELEQQPIESYPDVTCGIKRDIGLTEVKSTFKLTVATKTIDDESFSWMLMNARSQVSPSIILPDIQAYTIPGNGEVAIAGLLADQKVSATVTISAAPGKIALTQQPLTTASLTPATFEVDAGKVVFDPSLVGKRVIIWVYKTLATQKIWGGNMPISRYNDIEIHGRICGDKLTGKRFLFPKCTSSKGAMLPTGDGEYSREYTAFVDFERGFTSQYVAW